MVTAISPIVCCAFSSAPCPFNANSVVVLSMLAYLMSFFLAFDTGDSKGE
ncbi:MAG: hypothetical protein ACSLEN_07095 [Candidatus Malihini olakiniferum]